jgi:hypothetical protein
VHLLVLSVKQQQDDSLGVVSDLVWVQSDRSDKVGTEPADKYVR